MQGRQVATLMDKEIRTAGQHRIPFSAGNLSPGVYLCTLTTEQEQIVHKMVVTGN